MRSVSLVSLLAVVLQVAGCTSEHLASDRGEPSFLVVGTMHRQHLDEASGYSLGQLWATILAFDPDVVCGEITPEAVDGPLEGLFPPEAAMLASLGAEVGVRFVPSDWRGDYVVQKATETSLTAAQQSILDADAAPLLAEIQGFEGSVFDLFHDPDFQERLDAHHQRKVRVGGAPFSGYWNERNRRIVGMCLASLGPSDKRIVFAFGGDHVHGLQANLRAMGKDVVMPKVLHAGPTPVNRSVTSRWARNRSALSSLKSKVAAGTSDLTVSDALRVTESSRVEALSAFMGSEVGSQLAPGQEQD